MLNVFKNRDSLLDASSFDVDDYPLLQRFADDDGCDVEIVQRHGTYYLILESYDMIHQTPVDVANIRWLSENASTLADGSLRFGSLYRYAESLYIDVADVTEENVDELIELASYEMSGEPFSQETLGEVEAENLDEYVSEVVNYCGAYDYDEEEFDEAMSNLDVDYTDEGWPVYDVDDVREALAAAGAKFD